MEFEPALNQTIVVMPIGLFVVETGEFYPAEPLTKSIERTTDLVESVIVTDVSELKSIFTKVDIIMATIELALIPYKDN